MGLAGRDAHHRPGYPGAVYEGLAFTGGKPKSVARAFEQHRILRSEEKREAIWFELLHDGLIGPIRRGRHLSEGLAEIAGPTALPDDYLLMAQSALWSGMLPVAEEYARGAVRASEHDVRTLAEAKSFPGELVFDHGRAETGERAEQLFTTAEEHLSQAAQLFETQQSSYAVGRVLASLGRLHRSRLLRLKRRHGVRRRPGDLVTSRSDASRSMSQPARSVPQPAPLHPLGALPHLIDGSRSAGGRFRRFGMSAMASRSGRSLEQKPTEPQ